MLKPELSRVSLDFPRPALAIAVVLGLLIGFALGLHRLSAEAMEPMLAYGAALRKDPPNS